MTIKSHSRKSGNPEAIHVIVSRSREGDRSDG
jgi:hypothetical protein